MNSEKEKPDIVEYLVPFIALCRRHFDNDTLAEIHISRQLTEILFAVASELDCDTQREGVEIKPTIERALTHVMSSLDTIEEDVSRPLEERRQEVIAGLTKYQRQMLGIEENTDGGS